MSHWELEEFNKIDKKISEVLHPLQTLPSILRGCDFGAYLKEETDAVEKSLKNLEENLLSLKHRIMGAKNLQNLLVVLDRKC